MRNERRIFGRRRDIIWVALVACALAVPAAIADQAGPAGLKKDVKKALAQAKKAKKKANAANKKAKQALNQAGEPGPKGEKGDKGDKGDPGAPGADGGSGVERSDVAGTVATSSPTLESLGGPVVEVTLGAAGGFVQLFAAAEVDDGNAEADCRAYVTSSSLAADEFLISTPGAGTGFQHRATASFVNRFVPAGTHTFELEYLRQSGTVPCQFRSRSLFVRVIE